MENEILIDTKMGFRRRRGTVDAIAVVKNGYRYRNHKRKREAVPVFADMKGAFDTLKREEIWKRFQEEGVDEQLRIRMHRKCTIDLYALYE